MRSWGDSRSSRSRPLSTRADILPKDLLGKSITVKVELRSAGAYRYFNGYVTRFAQGGTVGRYSEYRMTVASWLWFLTRTADCRIFQEKTVPEIVKEVFADHSVAVFELGLTGTYGRREYCVQYRETDFDFVSRLMEEEGIYHYFDHQDGRHVLKLVDSYSGHKALENAASIAYYPPHQESHSDEEFIHDLTCIQGIQPGVVALDDYDFTKPKADLAVKAQARSRRTTARTTRSSTGRASTSRRGTASTTCGRASTSSTPSSSGVEAECNVREIAVGGLFNLTNAPRRDQDREYLIVGAPVRPARQRLRDRARGDLDLQLHVHRRCRAASSSAPPASLAGPPCRGRRPRSWSGPAARRSGPTSTAASRSSSTGTATARRTRTRCWIRVAQPWAGSHWGVISIPRIGQEVIVDFLEGDPDQPIISGRVYNADQMPPYALPANATQSGIKSRSSQGRRAGQLQRDPLRGQEGRGAALHPRREEPGHRGRERRDPLGRPRPQRRRSTTTRPRTSSTTAPRRWTTTRRSPFTANRTETVDKNETITIHQNRTETVDINETITIGANRTRSVGQSETGTVALQRTHTVGVNETITVGAAQEITVGAMQALTVGANQTESVGTNQSTTWAPTGSIDVSSARTVDTGRQRRDRGRSARAPTPGRQGRRAERRQELHIDAGDEIVITDRQASITMKKDGTIVIKGKDITIDGSEDQRESHEHHLGGSAKSVTKGSMVDVEASGVNTIKGGLVKIN